jgi:hypothetical protein
MTTSTLPLATIEEEPEMAEEILNRQVELSNPAQTKLAV